jgi:ASTRA-associated protein 1
VWRFTDEDESSLEKSLPVQGVAESHPRPWILHVLPVNSMNFCAFSACDRGELQLGPTVPSESGSCELLVAAPNALTLEAVSVRSGPVGPVFTFFEI